MYDLATGVSSEPAWVHELRGPDGRWIKGFSFSTVRKFMDTGKYDMHVDTGKMVVSTKPGAKAAGVHLANLPEGTQFTLVGGVVKYEHQKPTMTSDTPEWKNLLTGKMISSNALAVENNLQADVQPKPPQKLPLKKPDYLDQMPAGHHIEVADPDLPGEKIAMTKRPDGKWRMDEQPNGIPFTSSEVAALDDEGIKKAANPPAPVSHEAPDSFGLKSTIKAGAPVAFWEDAAPGTESVSTDPTDGKPLKKFANNKWGKEHGWLNADEAQTTAEHWFNIQKKKFNPHETKKLLLKSAFDPGQLSKDVLNATEGDMATFSGPGGEYTWKFHDGKWLSPGVGVDSTQPQTPAEFSAMISGNGSWGSWTPGGTTAGLAKWKEAEPAKPKIEVPDGVGKPTTLDFLALSKYEDGDKIALLDPHGNLAIFQKADTYHWSKVLKSGKPSTSPTHWKHLHETGYTPVHKPEGSHKAPEYAATHKVTPPDVPFDISEPTAVKDIPSPHDDKFPHLVFGTDSAGDVAEEPGGDGRDAVRHYTGAGAGDINPELRAGYVDSSERDFEADLDAAMRPLKKNVTLYRRVPVTAFGANGFSDLLSQKKDLIGKTVTDPGYGSTGWAAQEYNSSALVMKIHAKKGLPAVNAEAVSDYESEHEVLLGRGIRYKIRNIRKVTNEGGEPQTVIDVDAYKPRGIYAHMGAKPKPKFLGTEVAKGSQGAAANQLGGAAIGTVLYMDDNGHMAPVATKTSDDKWHYTSGGDTTMAGLSAVVSAPGSSSMYLKEPPPKSPHKVIKTAGMRATEAGIPKAALQDALPLIKTIFNMQPAITPVVSPQGTKNLSLMQPGTVIFNPDNPGVWWVKGSLTWTRQGYGGSQHHVLPGKVLKTIELDDEVNAKWRAYVPDLTAA